MGSIKYFEWNWLNVFNVGMDDSVAKLKDNVSTSINQYLFP